VRVLIGLAIAASLAALPVVIPRLGPSPLAIPARAVVASLEVAGAPSGGGSPVLAGASLETNQASVVLRLSGGASVRLAEATRVRVVSESQLRLDRGKVYVVTGAAGVPLRVQTRWGVVRDVGTEFEVRVTEDDLRLRVRTGMVELTAGHAATGEERIDAGTELIVSASGVERREISLDGPEWSWALGTAPAFDIEGKSLSEFLVWAAREKKLGLRFTPGSLEAKASKTILHGSIAKMTPEEALRAVLPTTGFYASTENSQLVVRSRR
jgi:ferric-dicitrate binding protein FerR (iron transport regulator)